ncbi:MAG: homoserine kinase [Anaerolineales bacterium]|nr:homoserine kinase [Anaerolineales bacterium]
MKKATVTVPASTANLGPGFDCLALALSLRNTVELYETSRGLEIDVEGEGEDRVALDATNLIARSAEVVFEKAGRRPAGLRVHAVNGIPVGSGLGSSSAAIVGGLAAANALVDARLTRDDLLRLATEIEGHPDNVSAALFGGLTLASHSGDELLVKALPVPPLKVVIVLPDLRLSTAEARAALPAQVPLKDAVFNIGRALFTVQAFTQLDFELLRFAMADRLHQPYRKALIPGFDEAVVAARKAGAAAVALSGAGPALAAFAPDRHWDIANAMKAAFEAAGLASRTFVLPVDRQGVQVQVSVTG